MSDLGPTPWESTPQHLDALAEANRVRQERARLLMPLRGAASRAAAHGRAALLLRDPPPELERALLWDVLCACRGTGAAGARRILRAAGDPARRLVVGEHLLVGKLTDRQRDAVCAVLLPTPTED